MLPSKDAFTEAILAKEEGIIISPSLFQESGSVTVKLMRSSPFSYAVLFVGLSIVRVGVSMFGVSGQGTGLAEANLRKGDATPIKRSADISDITAIAARFITTPSNNRLTYPLTFIIDSCLAYIFCVCEKYLLKKRIP